MFCSKKTYLLYEMEIQGRRYVRLSREDGRLDLMTRQFSSFCLPAAEVNLRDEHPKMSLEVYRLPKIRKFGGRDVLPIPQS